MVLKVLLELIAILIIAYGILHEDELIELEDVLAQWIRKSIKNGGFKK